MALISVTWDLPPEDRMDIYVENARAEWIPCILRQAGMTEFRAYRNPLGTTPQVMSHVEFGDMQSLEGYLQSMAYSQIPENRTLPIATRIRMLLFSAATSAKPIY